MVNYSPAKAIPPESGMMMYLIKPVMNGTPSTDQMHSVSFLPTISEMSAHYYYIAEHLSANKRVDIFCVYPRFLTTNSWAFTPSKEL